MTIMFGRITIVVQYYLRVLLLTPWLDIDANEANRDVFVFVFVKILLFGSKENEKITDVSVSGDIQLEQEGLSGLYDPQVEIDLICTFYNFPCA